MSVGVDRVQLTGRVSGRDHSVHVVGDVRQVDSLFAPKSVDCVFALDLIEHLRKEDGLRLLDAVEEIARRRVVIFTPNGFLPQGPLDGNPFQEHLSGWTTREMEARGYHVVGVNGWRPLRGEIGAIRLRPRWFWTRISLYTQNLFESKPRYAFQLFCVKDMEPSSGASP